MNTSDARPGPSQPPDRAVMNPGDIRLSSPQHDDELIRAYLLSRPPLYRSLRDTTGIDCLTMVLRRLHAHTMLGPDGFLNLRSFQDAERDNVIIRHSWQKFGAEVQERNDANNSLKMLKSELGNHGLGDDAHFIDLCTSALMNNTYWSQNEMRLLQPKVCWESFQVVGENAEEIASSSLLKLDLNESPDLTLQDVVNGSLGLFEREGKNTFHRPARPYIIRVLYNPGSQQRLSIQKLRKLSLPIWVETEDSTDFFDKSESASYVLLAVVRMRENSTGDDYARTYACQGSEIVCQYESVRFLSTDWSIEGPHNNMYMLFYGAEAKGQLEDVTAFPEVAPPALDDDHLDLLQDIMTTLDKHRDEILAERESRPVEEENSQRTTRTDGIAPSRSTLSVQQTGPEEIEPPVSPSQPALEQERPTKRLGTGLHKDQAHPEGREESSRPRNSKKSHREGYDHYAPSNDSRNEHAPREPRADRQDDRHRRTGGRKGPKGRGSSESQFRDPAEERRDRRREP